MLLDGSGDHISIPSFEFGGGDGITIEMWVNAPDPSASDAPLVDFGGFFGSEATVRLAFADLSGGDEAGRLRLTVDNTAEGGTSGEIVSIDGFPVGRWTHVAVVFDTTDGGTASMYWNAQLRAVGRVPLPARVSRSYMYLGKSTGSSGDLMAFLGTVRLWSVPREINALRDAVYVEDVVSEGDDDGLELQYLFQEEPLFVEETAADGTVRNVTNPTLSDTSGNGRGSEDGLTCSSLGCRFVDTDPRTQCGDGIRVGVEECDDGNLNSGDGCTDECEVESGYFCRGSDAESADLCSTGSILMEEDFEDSDTSLDDVWGWDGGVWKRSVEAKRSGTFGLSISVDDRDLAGCPDLVRYGAFRVQDLIPDTATSWITDVGVSTTYASVGARPSSKPVDPMGTGRVLEIGTSTYRSPATAEYFPVGPSPTAPSISIWHTDATNMTYRIGAWVMVEGDEYGGMLFDGEERTVRIRGYTSTSSLLFTATPYESSDPLFSKGALLSSTSYQIIHGSSFPSTPDVWEWVYLDLVVLEEIEFLAVDFGYAGESHEGRMWMQGLSITPHCPGLPSGAVTWLRADAGISQVDGTSIDTWYDLSGLHTNAIAQGDSGVLTENILNGLPVVRFSRTAGYTFNSSMVELRRPFTIVAVSRYNEDNVRGRFLQSDSSDFLVGHDSSRVGYRGRSRYVYRSSDPGGSARWDWRMYTATGGRNLNTFYLDGELMGTEDTDFLDVGSLVMGNDVGLRSYDSTVDLAEMLMFRRVLTDDEIKNLHTYLASKWGLVHDTATVDESVLGFVASSSQPELESGGEEVVSRASVDSFSTRVLEESFMNAPQNGISWGRKIATGVDDTSVLSMYIRVHRSPEFFGTPLWVILQDADATVVDPTHECLVRSEGFGACPSDTRFVRLCANGGLLSQCDGIFAISTPQLGTVGPEVGVEFVARSASSSSSAPIDGATDPWTPISIGIADRFTAKYGNDISIPSSISITIAVVAPRQRASVNLDDIRVITLPSSTRRDSDTDDETGEDCPRLEARSLSGISKVALLHGGIDEDWETVVEDGMTLEVSSSFSGVLHVNGTVPLDAVTGLDALSDLVNADLTSSITVTSTQSFVKKRVEEMWIRIQNDTSQHSTAAPVLLLCEGEVALAYNGKSDKWVYKNPPDPFTIPPAAFKHVKLSTGESEWVPDEDRDLGNIIPHHSDSTYVFEVKIDAVSSSWTQLFMRGGEGDYYNDRGQNVYGSRDRNPVTLIRPYTTRIRAGVSTNRDYNGGCETEDLSLGVWHHVAITMHEFKGVFVYVNGVLSCYDRYSSTEWRVEATNRNFHTIHESFNPATDAILRNLKYYDSSLSLVEVETLALGATDLIPTSVLHGEYRNNVTDDYAKVTCELDNSLVRVFEDGVLRLEKDRNSVVPRVQSASNVKLSVTGAPGDAVSIDISPVEVREHREVEGIPVFCPGSGTSHVIAQVYDDSLDADEETNLKVLSHTDALNVAKGFRYAGVTAYVASINSEEEADCIAALLRGCQQGWVGMEREEGIEDGAWRHVYGSGSGGVVDDALLATLWADAEPQGSASTHPYTVMHPGGSCVDGSGVRRRSLGACDEDGCDARAVVLELEPSEAAITVLSLPERGAFVASASSYLAADSSDWHEDVSSDAERLSNMRYNVLQPESSHLPTLASGDSDFIFADNAPSSSTQNAIMVDLGQIVFANRLAMEVGVGWRAPKGMVRVWYSKTSSTFSSNTPEWHLGGMKESVLGEGEVAFGLSDVTPMRWVRFEFGRQRNVGVRVRRVMVERVRGRIARLLVNGTDVVDADFATGLYTAVLSPNASIKAVQNFTLDSDSSIRSFENFVEDEVEEDDDVLLASYGLQSPDEVFFQDDFAAPMNRDSVNRIRVFDDVSNSVQEDNPGKTWTEQKEHCEGKGYELCSFEHVCRSPGYGYEYGYPYHDRPSGSPYLAVGDAENMFVAVGRDFSNSQYCGTYEQLNGGDSPSEALQSSWTDTKVACCRRPADTGMPRYIVVHEGMNNNTGTNPNEDGNTRYPPYWELTSSQLRGYGRPWNNPSRSGGSIFDRWTSERCSSSHEQAGSSVILSEASAMRWTDYKVSVSLYQDNYAAGLVARWTAPGNYYRYLIDANTNCHVLVRANNFVMTLLTAKVIQSTSRRTWYDVGLAVSGYEDGVRVVATIDGETMFDVTDSDNNRHSRGSIGFYNWFDNGARFDNVIVTANTASSTAPARLGAVINSLGGSSATGLLQGSSWAMIGKKGGLVGSSAVSFDDDGSLVSVSRIFTCSEQSVTIPERFSAGNALPVPLVVHGSSRPGQFDLVAGARGNESDLGVIEVSRSDGTVMIADASRLNARIQPTLNLEAYAHHRRFDSGFFRFGAQAARLSFKEMDHDLLASPAVLKVDTVIRPFEGENQRFRFSGTGNIFVNDDRAEGMYGGLLVGFNSKSVRLWAPSVHTGYASGYLVKAGYGWGGLYEAGELVEEAYPQLSLTADVKVTVERLSPPDFDSGWLTMTSGLNTGSAMSVNHELGEMPGRVRVLIRATAGPNAGYAFEASGSAQSDDDWSSTKVGMGVFGYNEEEVRVWLPSSDSMGYAVFVGRGWGGNLRATTQTNAQVRVSAWLSRVDPDFDSGDIAMVSNADAFREVEHGLGRIPGRLLVTVSPRVGESIGFQFLAQGMAQAHGWENYWEYGGVIVAVNETHARLWAPSPNPHSYRYPNNDIGAAVFVDDGWGGELWDVKEDVVSVRVKAWVHDADVLHESVPFAIHVREVIETPTLTSKSIVVEENQPAGKLLTSLDALDNDCEDGVGVGDCSVVFTIVAGNEEDAVVVDAFGKVRVNNEAAFNYEARSRITVVVRAFDGLTASLAFVRIDLTDGNDAPVLQTAYVSVEEEVVANTKVGSRLVAEDEDGVQAITYEIVGGNRDGYFKIGKCDGQIRTTGPIDYEEHANFTLLVTVTDDHPTDPRNSTGTVYVSIINLNDPPRMEDHTIYIKENVGVGKKIGTPVDAVDDDGDPLLFELLTGDDRSQFFLDNSTGQFYVAREGFLDFEADPEEFLSIFTLLVAVSDAEFSIIASVTLEVVDAQDPPFISSSDTVLVVPELSAPGTSVGTVATSDQDVGDVVKVDVVSVFPSELNGVFVIDVASTGAVTTAGDSATLLNYETTPYATIWVRANDSAGSIAEANLTIFILDMNEAPTLTSTNFSIAENSPFGTEVGVVEYYDDDVMGREVEDRELTFEILSGNEEGIFAFGGISNPSSIVVLRAELDAERLTEYDLEVSVTDELGLNATAWIHIDVLNRNDPPRFVCNDTAASHSMWRGGMGFDAIFTLLFDPFDPDTGDGIDVFRLTIADVLVATGLASVSGQAPTTTLSSTNRAIADAKGDDLCKAACYAHALCRGYTFYSSQHRVPAIRGACVGRADFVDLLVSHTDYPLDTIGRAHTLLCDVAYIAENPSGGVEIITLTAVDDEGDDVVFNVREGEVGDVEEYVEMSDATLLVKSGGVVLSHEDVDWPMLVPIDAFDVGGEGIAVSAWVGVFVTDLPEAPTLSSSETGTRVVGEETPTNTPLFPRVIALEEDEGDYVTWSILSGNTDTWFKIDASTGLISTATTLPALDALETRELELNCADTQGNFFTTTITITILNSNKPPIFTNADDVRSVSEEVEVGEVIDGATVVVTDGDGNDVTFALVSVTVHPDTGLSMVSIDETSGELIVGPGELDYELVDSINITVTATDHPPDEDDTLVTYATIQITVLDAAEPPEANDVTIYTPEDIGSGVLVGEEVVWRDEDDGDAPLLTFWIEDIVDEDDGFFTLTYDSTTPKNEDGKGRAFKLFLGNGFELDYETKSEYEVHVGVSDGIFNVTGIVTVVVEDVREPPTLHAATFSIEELDGGYSVAQVIGTIPVTDPDANTTFHWTIVSNHRLGGFNAFAVSELNGGSLVLLPSVPLDYELDQTLYVTVEVRDSLDSEVALLDRRQYEVNVVDVNDVQVTTVRTEGSSGVSLILNTATASAVALLTQTQEAQSSLSTVGGEQVLFVGKNFGWASGSLGLPAPEVSVTYGGTDGLRYTATNCVIVTRSTGITCDTVGGVGGSMKVRVALNYSSAIDSNGVEMAAETAVYLSGARSEYVDTRIGYKAPVVTGIGGDVFDMDTAGDEVITLTGSWFGPLGDAWAAPAVTYEIPSTTPSYHARLCSVTVAQTEISCLSAPGVGSNHTWTVSIGAQLSTPQIFASAYRPPAISSVTVDSSGLTDIDGNLRSEGGTKVWLDGESLGPIGDHTLEARFGPGDALLSSPLFAAPCSVIEAHARLLCIAPAGLGGNHSWRIVVAGQPSLTPSTDLTSYQTPVLTIPTALNPSAVSGTGAYNASTTGGEFVVMVGEGFGPTLTSLPEGLVIGYDVTYGETGVEYRATSCQSLSDDGTVLQCVTAEGTGKDLSWRVRPVTCDPTLARSNISTSTACEGFGSAITSLGTSYSAPVVASISGDGSASDTEGGEVVVMDGVDFGPTIDTLDWVRVSIADAHATSANESQLPSPFDTPIHYPRGPEVFLAESCTMTIPHEQVKCLTPAAAGTDVRWEMSVSSQNSISPRYRYLPPEILSIEGDSVSALSTRGGEVVRLVGKNFGTEEFLGNVTYGPASSPYLAKDCVITVPHYEIECTTVPGAGAKLSWRVTVEGQTSVDSVVSGGSGAVTSYSTPVISTIAPLRLTAAEEAAGGHVTEGGVRMVLSGSGYGPATLRIAVVFGKSSVVNVVSPTSCILAQRSSASFDTMPEGCAYVVSHDHGEVRFDTPPGQGTDLVVKVYIQGSWSNSVTYSYSPPIITRLTATEPAESGDPWTLHIVGSNFGVTNEVLVRPLVGGSPYTLLSTVSSSHTTIVVTLSEDEGEVSVQSGGQTSNSRIYSQASPIILQMEVESGEDALGREVAVGATSGGFRMALLVQNLGKIQSPAYSPPVFVTVGDGDASSAPRCVLDPLAGTLESDGSYTLDTSVFTINADTITRGTIECTAPSGAGKNQSVKVWRLNSDQSSSDGESEPQYIDYLPPSDLAFVDDGTQTGLGGTSTHWKGGVGGSKVRLSGQNLFTGEGIRALEVRLIATTANSGIVSSSSSSSGGRRRRLEETGEVPASSGNADTYRGERTDVVAWVDVPAVVLTPHEEIRLTLPRWQGENLVLEIEVKGQVNTPSLLFSYESPVFNFALSGADGDDDGTSVILKPTAGGTEVVVTGVGFGEFRPDLRLSPPKIVSGVSVTCYSCLLFGGVEATCSLWTDTRLECTSPAAQGSGLQIIVVAGGVPSADLSSTATFTYDPPSISNNVGPWVFDTDALVPKDEEVARLLAAGEGELAANVNAEEGVVRDGNVMVRGYMILDGDNFGTRDGDTSAVLLGDSIVIPASSSSILSWTHTRILLKAPVGDGIVMLVRVDANGQISTPNTTAHNVAYNPPQIAEISPKSAPTDGCYKWESVTAANRGSDAQGLPLRLCCEPALVTIEGRNFGRPGQSLLYVGDSLLRRSCEETYDEVPIWPGGGSATHGDPCPSACSNEDGFYAATNPEECAERTCCRYESFPVRLDDEFYCPCPVPSGGCIVTHTHTTLKFRPPPGFGANNALRLVVAGQPTDARTFAYDAPEVHTVLPSPYNARGSALRVEGKNFGALRTNVSLTLDGEVCDSTSWHVDARGITSDGLPYLTCDAKKTTVGNKRGNITVEGVVGVVEGKDAVFVASCERGDWGREGEVCLSCPEGAECAGGKEDPFSVEGWWELQLATPNDACHKERQERAECPVFVPCLPQDACAGNNTCTQGYAGERCAECKLGYYRLQGECVVCPDNSLLIFVFVVIGAFMVALLAILLNSKGINVAVMTIAVDYFQILAIFATARISWPPEIRTLFHIMSAFNLNIELAVPECSFPNVSFTYKFLGVLGLPLAAALVFFNVTMVLTLYKRCILRYNWKDANRHSSKLVSSLITMVYFFYLYITRTTFEAYRCEPTTPPDGWEAGYMQATFAPCFAPGGVHLQILPYAIASSVIYVLGFPLFIAFIIYRNRELIETSQVLRAKRMEFDPRLERDRYLTQQRYSRLYYMFKPNRYAWVLAILARKFLIAISALLFNRLPAFQMAVLLLIVFVSYVITVLYRPYMSPYEYEAVAQWWERRQRLRRQRQRLLQLAGMAEEKDLMKRVLTLRSDAWTTAKQRKSHFRMDRLNAKVAKEKEEYEQGKAGVVKYDYNMIEATLLCCAVFVTLSGIMFESGQLDDEYYNVQRATLTWIVIITVSLSIIFIAMAFAIDLAAVLPTKTRLKYCSCFVQRREAVEDMVRKSDQKGKGGTKQLVGEGDFVDIFQAANPMVGGELADRQREAASALDDAAVTKTTWDHFREEYSMLYDEVQRKKAEIAALQTATEDRRRSTAFSPEGTTTAKIGTTRRRRNAVKTSAVSSVATALARGKQRFGALKGVDSFSASSSPAAQAAIAAAEASMSVTAPSVARAAFARRQGRRKGGGKIRGVRELRFEDGVHATSSSSSTTTTTTPATSAASATGASESGKSLRRILSISAKARKAPDAGATAMMALKLKRKAVKAKERVKAKDPDIVEASKGLPPGWKAFKDPKRNRIFYFEKATKKRQWTKPGEED